MPDTTPDVLRMPTTASTEVWGAWITTIGAFGVVFNDVDLERPVTITFNPDEETVSLDCDLQYAGGRRVHAHATRPATIIWAALAAQEATA